MSSPLVIISQVADGNMYMPDDKENQSVIDNRIAYLESHDLSIDDAVRVNVLYEGNDYCRYLEVDSSQRGAGMRGNDIAPADALVTRTPGLLLFLPLADCVGMVVYDPDHHVLMLSHVGRHSLEQNGAFASVKHLAHVYGSDPTHLKIWLTPAPGQQNYPVHAFHNRDFKEIVFEQLDAAGVVRENVVDNPSDSTTDDRYFSHSEFLAGRRSSDGRYAIVAVM
jgi:copper oxidase (laccase) domain-containing protein